MLSLRQIEVLRAVMLTGSITGAAKMLHVSTPSVSRMLRHSESVVGIPFFDRGPHGFVPTPEAATLMDDLEAIHDRVVRLNRRLAVARGQQEGELSIGVSPGLGLSIVPHALASLHAEKPDIDLSLDVLYIEEIVPQLLIQQVDLALTIYDIDDPRIISRRLGEGRLICLTPKTHPLAGRRAVSVRELAGEPFVGFHGHQFQQKMIEELCQKSNVIIDPLIRVRLTVSALAMVRHGLGITLLDSLTAHGAEDYGVCPVPLEEEVAFPLNLFYNPSAPLSQIAEVFAGMVEGQIREIESVR
ncbi:LysR family transcriptional regulator [Hoeflea sp. CAU 1731]